MGFLSQECEMGNGDNQSQEMEEEKEEDILMAQKELMVSEVSKTFNDMKPRLGKLYTNLTSEQQD